MPRVCGKTLELPRDVIFASSLRTSCDLQQVTVIPKVDTKLRTIDVIFITRKNTDDDDKLRQSYRVVKPRACPK